MKNQTPKTKRLPSAQKVQPSTKQKIKSAVTAMSRNAFTGAAGGAISALSKVKVKKPITQTELINSKLNALRLQEENKKLAQPKSKKSSK